MAKIIGNITWVAQPGYPELTGEEGNEKITHKFVAAAETLGGNIPDYNSVFYDERWPFFSTFDQLRLASRTIKAMSGGKHVEITLAYSVPPTSEFDEQGIMMEVEYQTNEIDVPLAGRNNYRAHWNHKLAAKEGTSDSPDWWSLATDTNLSDADAKKYKWLKPDDADPEGWKTILKQTKLSESFKGYMVEVIMTKRSVSKHLLQRIAAFDGTMRTPPDTFGKSGQWLQGASSIR
jgi:hypothetical protein